MKSGRPKIRPVALPLRAGLFALMFLAVLLIGAHVYDIGGQIAKGEDPSVIAPLMAAEEAKHEEAKAEEKKPEEHAAKAEAEAKPAEPAKEGEKKAGEKKDEESASAKATADESTKPGVASGEAGKKADAPAPDPSLQVDDPNFDPPELTESEINVLRHLSDRRKTLEKRAREMDQRETLLNLSEQRVDKKLDELKKMQEEIRKTLGQADADYKKQVASMVKIYETMKAKDAAKIFGNMDMPTLIEVVSRMKEAKAAPILAAMDATKAKELSTQLMAKKNLPATP